MKIVLNNLQLTGDSPEEGVSDFRIAGQADVAVGKPLRALSVEPLRAELQAHRITFSIERTHASAGAAEFFLFQHLRAIALRLGRLDIQCLEGTQPVGLLYFPTTALQAWTLGYTGASTRIGYDILAGAPVFQS